MMKLCYRVLGIICVIQLLHVSYVSCDDITSLLGSSYNCSDAQCGAVPATGLPCLSLNETLTHLRCQWLTPTDGTDGYCGYPFPACPPLVDEVKGLYPYNCSITECGNVPFITPCFDSSLPSISPCLWLESKQICGYLVDLCPGAGAPDVDSSTAIVLTGKTYTGTAPASPETETGNGTVGTAAGFEGTLGTPTPSTTSSAVRRYDQLELSKLGIIIIVMSIVFQLMN